jgi:HEAT repeat protein
MRLMQFGQLLGCRAALGIAGSRAAGARLVSALGSDEEDVRVTAGMLLTRAGRRAEPILLEALKRRENAPAVLEVLGSIGDRAAEPEVERFMHDADPEVAQAASDAYRGIQFQHERTPFRGA